MKILHSDCSVGTFNIRRKTQLQHTYKNTIIVYVNKGVILINYEPKKMGLQEISLLDHGHEMEIHRMSVIPGL